MKLGWTCLFLLGFILVIGQNLNVPPNPTSDLVTSLVVPTTDCGENFPFQSVRAMAEWEEIEAIVIAWEGGYDRVLSEIVRAAQSECTVYILAQNTSVPTNALAIHGVTEDNVKFVSQATNTIWIRDYGPNTVYRNGVNERHFVDWLYNRNRPQDDIVAQSLPDAIQSPLHCLTKAPTDLVHTGGNFMCDGMGTGFSTKIILHENGPNNEIGVSNHTEEAIDAIMFESMGIYNYIKMDTLSFDKIHHMDMHMKLIDEETLLAGEYPLGVADGPQIEANLKYIQDNFTAPSGNPYRVVRIPMPSSFKDGQEVYPPAGPYRTYTNALILNKSILLPTYGIPMDQTAIEIWQKAMPGYKIKSIDCNSLVDLFGAIHCVTKEIGVRQPLWIGHAKPWSACNNINNKFVAQVDHISGIEYVNMKYWTNSNPADVKELAMTLKVGEDYEVEFPAIEDGAETIYYYFEAEAKNGKTIQRPMTAPEGFFQLPITKCLSSLDRTLPLQNQWTIFPNPATDLLSIKVEGKNLDGNYEVTLMNSLGEIFEQKSVQENSNEFINITLNLSGLTTGIYFVSIGNETGRGTKKVFINRP